MTRILSIGAAVQDVFMSHSDAFKPVCLRPHECFEMLELGSKADVNKIDFSTGGGATNAAVTFARQGLDAAFMGTIGHDPAGQAVLDDLDHEGVDTAHVSYSEKYNTGYSMLLLAPNGERTILTYRGASTHYHMKDFQLDDIKADWLYVSSLAGQMDILDHILTSAKQKGIKVMLNPGRGELENPAKLKSLLADVDVLMANREEMQQIVEGSSLEELARHAERYVNTVIVTDGSDGVLATDGKTVVHAGMYDDVKVVDRTGAGDAFGSGFLSQYCQGKGLRDSVLFASANSTSVVTAIGAKTAILRKGAVLHEMPITEREF